MFIKKVFIRQYKSLQNISAEFEPPKPNQFVYPLISVNSGGKSSLVQFIFAFLHCPFHPLRKEYLRNLLEFYTEQVSHRAMECIAQFEIEHKGKNIDVSFYYCSSRYKGLDFDAPDKLEELLNARGSLLAQGDEFKISMAKDNVSKLENKLKEEGLSYIFRFSIESMPKILLFKSNADQATLQQIADLVYLASPNTQVLHFFDTVAVEELLFSTKNALRYEGYVGDQKKYLTGLFTYDYSIANLVKGYFENARDQDFKQALRTGKYGTKLSETVKDLDSFFPDKSVSITDDLARITFTKKDSNLPLRLKDLSHGELKRLSIYLWLKTKVPNGSLVLMDEVDISLHPTWQQDLCSDLQTWSPQTQFILATHSPQIITATHFKNLLVLNKTSAGSTLEQFKEPPLENNLNTVVKTIMGVLTPAIY